MARTVNEMMNVNWSGLTTVSFEALKTPAMPAVEAPSAKARSFVMTVLIAVRRRGQLVLADGLPGPADAALHQAVAEDHHDRDEHEHRHVVRPGVHRPRTSRCRAGTGV